MMEFLDKFKTVPGKPQYVYVSDDEIVVEGIPPGYDDLPDDDPRQHNCDVMGCSSISHVIFRFDLRAQLAARDGELALVCAMLDEALDEFADCIPYSQPYFDEKWGYSETLKRLKELRQNSAPRAAQLGALLDAVGKWANETKENGEPVFMTKVELDLVDAYRAAYPPEPGK